MRLQPLCLLFLHLGRQSHFRFNGHYRSVGVVQKIRLDERFKITAVHPLPQPAECVIRLDMDKRLILIIQPAVKNLQPVHKPFRIRPKVCFTVPEFQGV